MTNSSGPDYGGKGQVGLIDKTGQAAMNDLIIRKSLRQGLTKIDNCGEKA